MRRAILIIAASGLAFFAWRVSQQRGTLTQRIQSAASTLLKVPQMTQQPAQQNAPRPAFDPNELLNLIARAEAGAAGYNAYYLGSRIRPPKPVTEMTILEVQAWQRRNAAAGSVSTAVGRYQFIAATFNRLVARIAAPANALFDAPVQNAMAMVLLQEAGLTQFRNGAMSPTLFAANLAKVWAGLPRGPDNISYYAGVAGNRSRVSWNDVLAVLT